MLLYQESWNNYHVRFITLIEFDICDRRGSNDDILYQNRPSKTIYLSAGDEDLSHVL